MTFKMAWVYLILIVDLSLAVSLFEPHEPKLLLLKLSQKLFLTNQIWHFAFHKKLQKKTNNEHSNFNKIPINLFKKKANQPSQALYLNRISTIDGLQICQSFFYAIVCFFLMIWHLHFHGLLSVWLVFD